MADGEETKESVVAVDQLERMAAELLSEDKENIEYDRAIAELVCEARGELMEKAPKVLADLWRRKQADSVKRDEELRKIETIAAMFLNTFEALFGAECIEEHPAFIDTNKSDSWNISRALLYRYRQLKRLLGSPSQFVLTESLKRPTRLS